jgi:hypothetical protein
MSIPLTAIQPNEPQDVEHLATLEAWGALPEKLPIPDVVRYLAHLTKQNSAALQKVLLGAIKSGEIRFWGQSGIEEGGWREGMYRTFHRSIEKPRVRIGADGSKSVKLAVQGVGRPHLEAMAVNPRDAVALLIKRGRKVPNELLHLLKGRDESLHDSHEGLPRAEKGSVDYVVPANSAYWNLLNFVRSDDTPPSLTKRVDEDVQTCLIRLRAELEALALLNGLTVEQLRKQNELCARYERAIDDLESQYAEHIQREQRYVQQRAEKARAGRYTLEEAANELAASGSASEQALLHQLIHAAAEGMLPVYQPGLLNRLAYGNQPGQQKQVLAFYEESYAVDINAWLEANHPRMTARLPVPCEAELLAEQGSRTDRGERQNLTDNPTRSETRPRPLSTRELAQAFSGMENRDTGGWARLLGDKSGCKWALSAQVAPGARGKRALWNPVEFALLLRHKRQVPEAHLKKHFRERSELAAWKEEWRERLAQFDVYGPNDRQA